MKTLCDYHVHTTFSDGKNTPEEIILAAIEKGMKEIGFSDHSYTFFDESYCIQREKIAEYKREIARLKEKYRDRIKILCGIEQDLYSAESTEGYDYAIGSVHYVKKDDVYYTVDESEKCFLNNVKKAFGGDYVAFAEEYYNSLARFSEMKEIKIIGHFDLVTKFNENCRYFDESDKRYVAAWKSAADKLLAANKIFEINTGAIARGYRSKPYPSESIRKYIRQNGGKFILSSDSHNKDTLCFSFGEYEEEL